MPFEKLAVGSSGEQVALLHRQLEARGYSILAEEARRSFFGPATADAVREYQRSQGLTESGEVDEPTALRLRTPRRRPVPPRVPRTVVTPVADDATRPHSEFERHLVALKPHLA